MPTRDEVIEMTKKIIYDNVPDMYGTDIQEDTVLNTETAIDSMGFILIMSKLEGAFDVHIPDEEWNRLSTLGDVADAVMRNLEQQ